VRRWEDVIEMIFRKQGMRVWTGFIGLITQSNTVMSLRVPCKVGNVCTI